MTTLVDLQNGSVSAVATTTFSQKPRAFMRALAVSAALMTPSLLTGGVLKRDGILRAVSTSSMSASAGGTRVASMSAVATSSMSATAAQTSFVFLEELVVVGGDYAYAEGYVTLEPLTIDAVGALPGAAYYAVGASELAPLLVDGFGYTGRTADIDFSSLPLQVMGGNYPYAGTNLPPGLLPGGDGSWTNGEPGNYLQPLVVYGYDAPQPVDNGDGTFTHQAYLSEFLWAFDTGVSSGSQFSAAADSGMSLTTTASATGILQVTVADTLTVETTLDVTSVYLVEWSDTVRIILAVGRDDTYATWVMNADNAANSSYEGFEFNSLAVWRGRHLAAGPGGLFELLGATDNGTAISANVLLGKTDLDDPRAKRMEAVYAGVEAADGMEAVLHTDDGRSYSYDFADSERLQTKRVVPGKGLNSRYWTLELKNKNGGDFTLESVELLPATTPRRIK